MADAFIENSKAKGRQGRREQLKTGPWQGRVRRTGLPAFSKTFPSRKEAKEWVTDPIGATNGAQCKLAKVPVSGLPSLQPTLTEKGVTAWDAQSGQQRIDSNPDIFRSIASKKAWQWVGVTTHVL